MKLSPYRRENSLFGFMDEMERSFFNNSLTGAVAFRTDITEKDGRYTMEAELPGFSPDDISIELNDDTLTITASNEISQEEVDKEGSFIRQERRYGSFSRSFDVTGIDTEKIEADYENGLLKLTMPKKEQQAPKSRKIEVGKKDGGEREIPLHTEQSNDTPVQ